MQKSASGGPKFQQIFEKVKSSANILAKFLKELRARGKIPGFRPLKRYPVLHSLRESRRIYTDIASKMCVRMRYAFSKLLER